MNQNQSANPTPSPDASALNERIMRSLRTHRRFSRVLTSVALFFGFISIAASLGIVWFYFIFYLPKQKTLLRDYTLAAEQARTNAPATPPPPDGAAPPRKYDLNGAHVWMTHVTSMGTMLVAISVGALGLGTLVTLALVILNRRVTLRQINASLAQISEQMRELRNKSPGP